MEGLTSPILAMTIEQNTISFSKSHIIIVLNVNKMLAYQK